MNTYLRTDVAVLNVNLAQKVRKFLVNFFFDITMLLCNKSYNAGMPMLKCIFLKCDT